MAIMDEDVFAFVELYTISILLLYFTNGTIIGACRTSVKVSINVINSVYKKIKEKRRIENI